jgi:hypothetical protein
MKIKASILGQIALMICGDFPDSVFPYRSSSYLTQFFKDIDLDYTHDGSTRRWWVQNVLEIQNNLPEISPNLPSLGIKNIIENLLNPIYFIPKQSTTQFNQNKAINKINELLKTQNLAIVKNIKNNSVSLFSLDNTDLPFKNQDYHKSDIYIINPLVFKKPDKEIDNLLASVMMPFNKEFDDVYTAIKSVCNDLSLDCKRADDIWKNPTIIQDIFELIYCSRIVIIDCSKRNSNVFYEAGIAHTLGKIVIPITQNKEDIPFDLQHHRYLYYMNNGEGLRKMENDLKKAIQSMLDN